MTKDITGSEAKDGKMSIEYAVNQKPNSVFGIDRTDTTHTKKLKGLTVQGHINNLKGLYEFVEYVESDDGIGFFISAEIQIDFDEEKPVVFEIDRLTDAHAIEIGEALDKLARSLKSQVRYEDSTE